MIGGEILGKWGLNLLYGEEVAEYDSLLMPLIICTILTATVWMLCGVLTVVREFKGLIVSNSVALIVSVIVSPVLIKYFDMQGAGVAACLGQLVEVILLFVFLHRKLQEQFAPKFNREE